jgi:hypothetical protein
VIATTESWPENVTEPSLLSILADVWKTIIKFIKIPLTDNFTGETDRGDPILIRQRRRAEFRLKKLPVFSGSTQDMSKRFAISASKHGEYHGTTPPEIFEVC